MMHQFAHYSQNTGECFEKVNKLYQENLKHLSQFKRFNQKGSKLSKEKGKLHKRTVSLINQIDTKISKVTLLKPAENPKVEQIHSLLQTLSTRHASKQEKAVLEVAAALDNLRQKKKENMTSLDDNLTCEEDDTEEEEKEQEKEQRKQNHKYKMFFQSAKKQEDEADKLIIAAEATDLKFEV
jgi:hypothetical protein